MPRLVLAIFLALALSACAQQAAGPAGASAPVLASPDPTDPYEQTNRAVLNAMLAFDDAVVLPVAKAYRDVVPGWGRDRLRNVLQNLQEPGVAVNRLLQGRPLLAGQSVMRFVVNTTFGLGGLFDLEPVGGPPKQIVDFGQTLAVWGVPDGYYLMIPFIGPSTPRDFTGQVVNGWLNPVSWPIPLVGNLARGLVQGLDERERNIEGLADIRNGSLDPYARMRSLWRQNRNAQIGLTQASAPEILDDPGAGADVAPASPAVAPITAAPKRPRRKAVRRH
jgi:phospholipid-binding lipoprotein MlaA